jgi:hypothetical protein
MKVCSDSEDRSWIRQPRLPGDGAKQFPAGRCIRWSPALFTADFFTNYFISGRRIVSKNEPSTYLRRDSSNRTDATGILPTGVFGNGSIDFQSLTIDRLPTPETTKTS